MSIGSGVIGSPILSFERVNGLVRRASFDHLVGAGEHLRRNVEAESLGGLEVDHKLILCRRLHRKVRWFLAPENTVHVAGRATVLTDGVRSVAGKTSRSDKVAIGVHGGQSMAVGKS